MTQFTIGTRVRVTAAGGGLFYSGNKGKLGAVTRMSRGNEIIHVRFDDGVEDYGRPADLEVVTLLGTPVGIVVGSKVKVTRACVFMTKFQGQTGEVTRIDGRTIFVRFASGSTDYGMIDELELVQVKDKDGFISNVGNIAGKMPAPRGTKLDVLYNDGTLILDIAIGTGDSKRASNNNNAYSATTWAFHGTGSATIKAYRFPADRPAPVVSRRVTHAEMKEGMKVRYIGAATRGHEHWNFVVGQVYSCGNGGPINDDGTLASNNWGDWSWELVEQTETLDQQLAALRAEMDAANTEKREAQAALTEARKVYDAAEAKRVAVEARLTKHGLRLI